MSKLIKTGILKVVLIFLVILIDQLSKHFLYCSNFVLIPNLIGVRPSLLNTGGAWSILNDKMWLLIALSIVFVVAAAVFDFFFKNTSTTYSCAFGLILGGTIGNLIDRLFLGGVRDFIYFDFWESYPTFNLADVFLLTGMLALIVFAVFIYKPKKSKENK